MGSDDLADAISLLRDRRAEHAKQIERIDAALSALGVTQEPEHRPSRTTTPSISGMSARDKAVALAGEADRDWNTSEILAEWERRGDPIRGANPDNSLRAALSVAFQQGQLFRTAPGRYKSTKFKTDPGSLPLNGQNAQPESEGVVYEMNQPLG